MKNIKENYTYDPLEEKLNVYTHAFGLLLSVVALFLLINKSISLDTIWYHVSFPVFGASLIILYAASTFYHNAKNEKARRKLNIIDHASIYILIAGTYTPFALVTLQGKTGWIIFGITWGLALIGVILKIFFTGRFDVISTIAYVLMGWVIVFVFKPLYEALPFHGVLWLFLGGLFYTIGALLYSIKKIKFNHAIFHVFVLLGSFCHFIAVYFYV
ncbi:MAG: hemolysin III [Flavobacteriaceae bacterium]|jgi:hemolysin III|uniref:PAQR family membrane homeostasis protein TrhA n=1 Tax=Candidatus Marifrigoribacter sp. Uisw_064 TaxID=3230970 RepID=UPI003AE1DAE0